MRKETVAVRQDVLIFWKPGNVMAEMQGLHALKQFVRYVRYVIFTNFTHQVS